MPVDAEVPEDHIRREGSQQNHLTCLRSKQRAQYLFEVVSKPIEAVEDEETGQAETEGNDEQKGNLHRRKERLQNANAADCAVSAHARAIDRPAEDDKPDETTDREARRPF